MQFFAYEIKLWNIGYLGSDLSVIGSLLVLAESQGKRSSLYTVVPTLDDNCNTVPTCS